MNAFPSTPSAPSAVTTKGVNEACTDSAACGNRSNGL